MQLGIAKHGRAWPGTARHNGVGLANGENLLVPRYIPGTGYYVYPGTQVATITQVTESTQVTLVLLGTQVSDSLGTRVRDFGPGTIPRRYRTITKALV